MVVVGTAAGSVWLCDLAFFVVVVVVCVVSFALRAGCVIRARWCEARSGVHVKRERVQFSVPGRWVVCARA